MINKFTWQEIHDEGDSTPPEVLYYAYYGEEELGFIEFYTKWKKWVWNQNEDIIMSIECLTNVLAKLTWLRQRDAERKLMGVVK
jgi:hypothetical protein